MVGQSRERRDAFPANQMIALDNLKQNKYGGGKINNSLE